MNKQDSLTRELNRLDEYEQAALTAILRELRIARRLHPEWRDDLVYGSAIISEEAGDLTRECLRFEDECTDRSKASECFDRICEEAAQVGAMGLRFLSNVIR